MENYKYSIYSPGGNDTALVEKLVLDPDVKQKINDKIMKLNPKVEQVGFLDFKSKRLEMSGGEFCGNATRSAAYRFLNGSEGELKIQVSGVSKKLRTGVYKRNTAWAQMPVSKSTKIVKTVNNYYVVEMEGITQVVVNIPNKIKSVSSAKIKAYQLLKNFNLLKTVSASGVMFCLQTVEGISEIQPVVWVRDIKTLFYETACASGTTAVGIVKSRESKNVIKDFPILQPSGQYIFYSENYSPNGKYLNTSINGKMKVIKKNLTLTI